ncbi:predicted protein [Chaetomium globosum CBS 148.51]|uniref:Uncharacterized protein n=1 Tax=Chaetomium globosum (strain ATCC 6205 / CBS 148.51 / DSM 1962 / NBRC 6347 / NRRL 1970) TaxID=306901 RepID=Q2H8G6_CHAGB|nr:uncharacterized protein CHGG_03488 [Chaetomium globosum CBS 148.51]EAQ91553.1 predicted protein [Chaetomium globosum CBS 148.51]
MAKPCILFLHGSGTNADIFRLQNAHTRRSSCYHVSHSLYPSRTPRQGARPPGVPARSSTDSTPSATWKER